MAHYNHVMGFSGPLDIHEFPLLTDTKLIHPAFKYAHVTELGQIEAEFSDGPHVLGSLDTLIWQGNISQDKIFWNPAEPPPEDSVKIKLPRADNLILLPNYIECWVRDANFRAMVLGSGPIIIPSELISPEKNIYRHKASGVAPDLHDFEIVEGEISLPELGEPIVVRGEQLSLLGELYLNLNDLIKAWKLNPAKFYDVPAVPWDSSYATVSQQGRPTKRLEREIADQVAARRSKAQLAAREIAARADAPRETPSPKKLFTSRGVFIFPDAVIKQAEELQLDPHVIGRCLASGEVLNGFCDGKVARYRFPSGHADAADHGLLCVFVRRDTSTICRIGHADRQRRNENKLVAGL